jgi:hypothetical protein
MAQIVRAYAELAEELERAPDGKLLGPILEAFAQLKSEDDGEDGEG